MTSNRRAAALILAFVFLFLSIPAFSEGELAFTDLPQEIRPGKLVLLTFFSPLAGDAEISVTDGSGQETVLYDTFSAKTGVNSFAWDGTADDGTVLSPGGYTLRVSMGDTASTAEITVGVESPALTNVTPSDTKVVPGGAFVMHAEANMAGTLSMRLEDPDTLLYQGSAQAGENGIPWDGTAAGTALTPGAYTLTVQLTDDMGYASNAYSIPVTVADSQATVTMVSSSVPPAPVDYSPYPSDGTLSYWTLPMDLSDEAAIWEVLTQPITVLKGNEKQAYKLRAEPDDKAEAVGEVTYSSQSVRVIKTLDNGWTLVESYSSSFHDSTVKAWGEMVQGYVKTSLLQTKKPSQKYGIIIDKLTQRLYVFADGKLFSQLLISTGLPNEKQPYNETQAGEYLIVSRVGKFVSEKLQCEMGLRFNNGNLIHQVPYVLRSDGSKYFGNTEPKLGTKASHGCVRVQKEKNSEGVNMAWLWSNLELNTKVLIWEDYQGRQLPIPSADTALYYNPNGGSYYHSDPNCPSVKSKYLPLTPFTYGQLEEAPFDSLTRCPACAPPMRESEIEAVNEAHAGE